MNRNRGDVELSAQRTSIQRLDVLQFVNVADAFSVDLPVGERVEHECVVRIRAVCEMNCRFLSCRHDLVPVLLRACLSALEISS